LSELISLTAFRRLLAACAWFLIFAGAVWLGNTWYLEPGPVAAVWPASGLFLGVLFLRPYREWPALIVLAAAGQILHDSLAFDRPVWLHLGFLLSTTVEPVVGALLLRRMTRGVADPLDIGNLGRAFLAVVIVAPAFSAAVGASLVSTQFGAGYWTTWQSWWAADAVGILAFAPTVVLTGRALAAPGKLRSPSLETMALFGGLALAMAVVFRFGAWSESASFDLSYVLLAVVALLAIRLDVGSFAVAMAMTTALAVSLTDLGHGPFLDGDARTADQAFALQSFVGVALLSVALISVTSAARRRADDERIALMVRVEQSRRVKSMGEMAASLAHDFNNTLLAVRGSLELAIDRLDQLGVSAPGVGEHLAIAVDASDTAADLARELLNVGRPGAEQVDAVDLGAMVVRLAPMLEVITGSSATVSVSRETLPTIVMADRSRLEQVIWNLAVNSRDAMSSGGRLDISVRHDAATAEGSHPSGSIVLEVSDTGVGIEEEQLSVLFSPFFTTKSDNDGLGLGLSSVESTIFDLGGSINVESVVGEGTTVRVVLPAVQGVFPEKISSAATGSSILVCDDEEPALVIMAGILRRAGYDVRATSDPAIALMIGRSLTSIDLLIADVRMPEMMGTELASLLESERPGLPVLFVSGARAPEAAKGDAGFLAKPFTSADLRRRVEDALGAPAS